MAKWELLNNRHLLRDGVVAPLDFTPSGSGGWDHLEAIALAKRIVALLNAAEPGGLIEGAISRQNPLNAHAMELWRMVYPDKQVEAGAGQLREVRAPGDVWADTKPCSKGDHSFKYDVTQIESRCKWCGKVRP